MKRPAKRVGLTSKIFKIKNNFETYYTFDMPSQEYISDYIRHCLLDKKMMLGAIVFEYTTIDAFHFLSIVNKY